MDASEASERRAIVREAMTWLGTPYVSNGAVKGAGVDCGMILVRVFSDCGIIEPFEFIKICPCFDAGPWAKSVGLPGGKYLDGKF